MEDPISALYEKIKSKFRPEENDTLDKMQESRQWAMNATATMPIQVEPQRNMGSKHIVASRMKAFARKVIHTPDNAELAPELHDTKHKSAYQEKKEKRIKKEEEEFKQNPENWPELSRIQAMKKEFYPQREVENSDSLFGKDVLNIQNSDAGNVPLTEMDRDEKIQAMDKAMDTELKSTWDVRKTQIKALVNLREGVLKNDLSDAEWNSLFGYTADKEKSKGMPYFRTMNSILRKKLYKEGKGTDTELKDGDTDDVVEQSKQNYEAVTNCINALKKSKLPQDMVFKRYTDLATLLCMLNLDLSNDQIAMEKQLEKVIDMYNEEGNRLIFDRGFLSTTTKLNVKFPGNVEWIIQGHANDEAFYFGGKSNFGDEGEVLFQAGTCFRLLKICPLETGGKIKKGKDQITWKVYMETISKKEPLRGK